MSKKLGAVFSQMDSPSPNHNSWTIAQVTISTRGLPAQGDAQKVVTALRKKVDGCDCWKQNLTDPFPHIDSANWTLLALGGLSGSIDESDINSLIAAQNPDGWWPPSVGLWSESNVSFASRNAENASTYSTAMAVEALQNLLSRGSADGNLALKGKIKTAVELGAQWLISKQAHARWKDFPNSSSGSMEPLGLAGLVLHVLHHTNHDLPDVDREWLDRLPDDKLGALDWEANAYPVTVNDKGQFVKDSVRHLRLPWTIVATCDAYHNGSIAQRMRALSWIGTRTPGLLTEEQKIPHDKPFVSAELLIALRYLRGDSVYGYRVF